MKTTPHAALDALSKAAVANPIITGTTSTTGATGTASATSTASLKKFTIRIDADLLGRIRAAYLRDLAAGGEHRSLSAWAAAHLAAAVEEDEATHNHGRPFEPVAAGIVPQGPFQ
ncbi:hypothetical protein [Trueperella abortisuis]|uniref:hypothetical protein n=1 Tax=Trueperella abortisuis TaxID=445930 RepID=UPI0028938133|nr:hypothetical protein [Trueperella abortisuis]